MPTDYYARARKVADKQIRKWGAKAVLRRSSGDRDCWAMEAELSAHEKQALKNFNARVFLISAVGLTVAPAKEDSLITFTPEGVELPPLRQTAPVAPLAPGGYVVYWEIEVE
jgi:hypothetical protein